MHRHIGTDAIITFTKSHNYWDFKENCSLLLTINVTSLSVVVCVWISSFLIRMRVHKYSAMGNEHNMLNVLGEGASLHQLTQRA